MGKKSESDIFMLLWGVGMIGVGLFLPEFSLAEMRGGFLQYLAQGLCILFGLFLAGKWMSDNDKF